MNAQTKSPTSRPQHHIDPMLAQSAEILRRQIAAKRDCLVCRQRRRYSPARQRIIDQLGDQYRLVNRVQLDTEERTERR